MKKIVLLVILTTSFLLAGCDNDQVIEPDQKAIEQAILDQGIDTGNIIFTEKIIGGNAFSIYEKTDEYGVIQYAKSDQGWQYRGASGFGIPESGKPEPLTFGASTWLLGDYSLNGNNRYSTVFIGEVHQPDIAKVILEGDHGEFQAKILTSDNRRFWYHLSDDNKAERQVNKISGYSSGGKLIYEEFLSLPE